MGVQRRKSDQYFNHNAVLLTEEPALSVTDIADNLGISKDLLCKCRSELRTKEEHAFFGTWPRKLH